MSVGTRVRRLFPHVISEATVCGAKQPLISSIQRNLQREHLERLIDLTKPDYVAYHDDEWGVPVWDDEKMFEFLTLESSVRGS